MSPNIIKLGNKCPTSSGGRYKFTPQAMLHGPVKNYWYIYTIRKKKKNKPFLATWRRSTVTNSSSVTIGWLSLLNCVKFKFLTPDCYWFSKKIWPMAPYSNIIFAMTVWQNQCCQIWLGHTVMQRSKGFD